ncbi:hypothetical protein AAG906_008130 [Vitis piasezkii]
MAYSFGLVKPAYLRTFGRGAKAGVSTTTRLDGLSTGGAYLYLKTQLGFAVLKRLGLSSSLEPCGVRSKASRGLLSINKEFLRPRAFGRFVRFRHLRSHAEPSQLIGRKSGEKDGLLSIESIGNPRGLLAFLFEIVALPVGIAVDVGPVVVLSHLSYRKVARRKEKLFFLALNKSKSEAFIGIQSDVIRLAILHPSSGARPVFIQGLKGPWTLSNNERTL